MSVNEIEIERPVREVFDVLVDPATYPHWLVGAHQVVDIDDRWPATGSQFAHRIGFGPLQLPGSTTIRRIEPGRRSRDRTDRAGPHAAARRRDGALG